MPFLKRLCPLPQRSSFEKHLTGESQGSAVDHIRRGQASSRRQLHKGSTQQRVPGSAPVSCKLTEAGLRARGPVSCRMLPLVFVPVTAPGAWREQGTSKTLHASRMCCVQSDLREPRLEGPVYWGSSQRRPLPIFFSFLGFLGQGKPLSASPATGGQVFWKESHPVFLMVPG